MLLNPQLTYTINSEPSTSKPFYSCLAENTCTLYKIKKLHSQPDNEISSLCSCSNHPALSQPLQSALSRDTFRTHSTLVVFLVCVVCEANATELCSFHVTYLRNHSLPLPRTLPHLFNSCIPLRACALNHFTGAPPADW